MTTVLQLTLRLRIHDGRQQDFESLARECMQITRARDTGTLQYDWFLERGGDVCLVRETYRDSDAVLEHAVNLGDRMAAITRIADASLEICGSPSERLLGALVGLDVTVFEPFQSL